MEWWKVGILGVKHKLDCFAMRKLCQRGNGTKPENGVKSIHGTVFAEGETATGRLRRARRDVRDERSVETGLWREPRERGKARKVISSQDDDLYR
jgi:hypothetical protein